MSELGNLTERQRNCIPDVHFELIPIKNLVSNQAYQRSISQSHIASTIKDFNLYQINPVKVSRRDGINYVFDGQHTIEVIASESESRETPVWCMVYDDLDYKDEAHIFADQKKNVKSLLPYETFNAHVEAGDTKQMMICDLVAQYNLKISKNFSPGCICAVGALETIYEKYGYEVLDRTLRLAIGTWEGDKLSLSSGILKGIARMIFVYGDQLNEDTFKERVGRLSAKNIMRTAKDRRPGVLGYAEAMVMAYNAKAKYGLSMKKLYWNGKKKEDQEEDDINE